MGAICRNWLQNNSLWIVALLYDDFWNYRKLISKSAHKKMHPPILYNAYLERHNSYIGINANIDLPPTFPHGISGVFISNSASIGKNVIIYQHVTIGSNTVKGSKGFGAPTIKDGVLIGAGAKIIGNVTIGENARIGAGCIVTRDVPANSVVVMPQPRIIVKEGLQNQFVRNVGTLFS